VIVVTPSTIQALIFAPQGPADFGTLNAMTGQPTQPAYVSGNAAG
jgi:hypothetical protein